MMASEGKVPYLPRKMLLGLSVIWAMLLDHKAVRMRLDLHQLVQVGGRPKRNVRPGVDYVHDGGGECYGIMSELCWMLCDIHL
jgi:hypothetical protein